MLDENSTYAGEDKPLKSWWGQLNRNKLLFNIENLFKF